MTSLSLDPYVYYDRHQSVHSRRMTIPAARFVAAIACFVLAVFPSFAADDDVGLWSTIAGSMPIADQWSAGLLVQTRFSNDVSDLERTVLRPSITYKLGTVTALTLGYDAHFIELPSVRLEQRIWQQWASSFKMDGIKVSGQARLEQRFIENVDGTAVRLRLKARAEVPLFDGPWYGAVSNEYFVGLNDIDGGPNSGFDQNRFFVGAGRPLNEHVSAEFGYQMQYINRAAEDLISHQLILVLSYR